MLLNFSCRSEPGVRCFQSQHQGRGQPQLRSDLPAHQSLLVGLATRINMPFQFYTTSGGSCVGGALSWSVFLRFVQSMQRFVPRALFKMAAPYKVLSVLLGRNGYGRNGYWPKWFWAENVQMTSDAFIFNYAPVLARVLTQNGRLKNKDAIFVCLNFYATVRCKKALSERQLQGMPRSAGRRFLAHLSRRLRGELIVYRSSRRPSVRPCVRGCVHTFKHEYL